MKLAAPIWFGSLYPLMALAAEIPKDTHVLLKMVNSISTRTVQAGALLVSGEGTALGCTTNLEGGITVVYFRGYLISNLQAS